MTNEFIQCSIYAYSDGESPEFMHLIQVSLQTGPLSTMNLFEICDCMEFGMANVIDYTSCREKKKPCMISKFSFKMIRRNRFWFISVCKRLISSTFSEWDDRRKKKPVLFVFVFSWNSFRWSAYVLRTLWFWCELCCERWVMFIAWIATLLLSRILAVSNRKVPIYSPKPGKPCLFCLQKKIPRSLI